MSDTNIVSATISIVPKLPIKGIHYIGQYGTSGYAAAARGYLYHYFSSGFPITWEPLYFDNSKINDEDVYDVVIKSLIQRHIPLYDTVIMHSTPDLWPKFWENRVNILKNKIVIGYCTWESSLLPESWPEYINNSCNEVWCPSTYNNVVFKNSGVTVPIRTVPHVFLPQNLPPKESVQLISYNNCTIENCSTYTFYTIGELNTRKGIEDALTAFCQSFTKKNPVRFIIKVHYKDYSDENKKYCRDVITQILDKYPDHASVICIFDNMSNKQILALHSIGDCYVSLTKSEGFGLTIFDAFNYNKKIIVTGYGGHLDFLGHSYPGLISYEMGPVSGMSSFSKHYTENQIWAYPNIEHAQVLMKDVVNINT
jgi:glycosyltransferase involved in cell wall biosynthesis